jgi:putative DNA primase/helicase
LNQNPFDYIPTHKAEVLTNYKPKAKETKHAFWRRVHLVPFEVTISDDEKIRDYRERHLVPELPGILNWMLKGFVE